MAIRRDTRAWWFGLLAFVCGCASQTQPPRQGRGIAGRLSTDLMQLAAKFSDGTKATLTRSGDGAFAFTLQAGTSAQLAVQRMNGTTLIPLSFRGSATGQPTTRIPSPVGSTNPTPITINVGLISLSDAGSPTVETNPLTILDTDGDGTADFSDPDVDGDGIDNVEDPDDDGVAGDDSSFVVDWEHEALGDHHEH